MNHKKFLISLATGGEDGGKRAALALSAGMASLTLENKTVIFLTGNGSIWAFKDCGIRLKPEGFPLLDEMLKEFLDMGGQVWCCSVCADSCMYTDMKIHHGVGLRGFASVIEFSIDSGTLSF